MAERIIDRVAEAAGEKAAEQFVKAFGGQCIYLPRTLRPDHLLVRAVGLAAAGAICAALGGGHVMVPTGAQKAMEECRRRAIALSAQGLSAREIAKTLGCNVRTVHRWRARERRSQ